MGPFVYDLCRGSIYMKLHFSHFFHPWLTLVPCECLCVCVGGGEGLNLSLCTFLHLHYTLLRPYLFVVISELKTLSVADCQLSAAPIGCTKSWNIILFATSFVFFWDNYAIKRKTINCFFGIIMTDRLSDWHVMVMWLTRVFPVYHQP